MLASLKLWLLFFCSLGGLGECDFPFFYISRCGLIFPTFIYILYILLSYSVFVLPNYFEIYILRKIRDFLLKNIFIIKRWWKSIFVLYHRLRWEGDIYSLFDFLPGKIFFNYKPTKQTKQLLLPLKKFNPLIIFLLQKQQQLSTFL